MTGFCDPIRYSQRELLERDRNASKFFKKKKDKKYQNCFCASILLSLSLLPEQVFFYR